MHVIDLSLDGVFYTKLSLRVPSHSSLPLLITIGAHTNPFLSDNVYPAYGDLQLNEVVTLPPEKAPINASIAE